MNNIEQTRLARLRPEKLDDVSLKEQISLIQKACDNVNPEKIALVFHECDYNMQQTINRLRSGDFEDGGWQTAKSNNKKKNHNQVDQKINGGINLSDSERSLSQRTSPTSSLRDGPHRNDHYQYPSTTRPNIGRRGNDSGRSHFISSYLRYPQRNRPVRKATSSQPIFNETSLIPKQSNEVPPQAKSPSTDEYEFADGIPQSLSFDNSQMKTSLQTLSKRQVPSSIPHEPVSMHPTLQFPTEPIDIQFGDVQWNDSVPIAVSPSNSTIEQTIVHNQEEEKEEEIVVIEDTYNHDQNHDVPDSSVLNYMNHQTSNDVHNALLETANQLASLSITDNTISDGLLVVPPEGTSHLSDHLANTPSSTPNQYSSQPQAPAPISIARLPPTSIPRAPEPNSTNSQFMLSNLQQTNNGILSSAFTPLNTVVNYQPVPRDYSQTAATNWNLQASNYKTNSKSTMIPAGTYQQQQQQQQQAYQIPAQQQQQQFFFGAYPYNALSPAVVPVFASVDQWPAGTFSAPFESYPYPTPNYISAYPNLQQYAIQTAKYDQQQSYDKEYFVHYGQARSLNNDASYPQQQPSQPIKDTHATSKLSPNAATFCQGAPLTVSPTTATALYINPVGYPMPSYFPSVPGSIQPDRILSSMDNHDNRNGASYSSTNNRNNYYHAQQQQQQRTHNNNGSNSTWHLQQ